MGGAASAIPDNRVLRTALQRQLDEFYQDKVKDGLDDAQLQEAMTKEYFLMVEAIKSGQGHEKAAQHEPNVTLKKYQRLMDLSKEHDPVHYPMPQKSPRVLLSRVTTTDLAHPLLEKDSHKHLTNANIRRRSFADLSSKVTTQHKLRESDIRQFIVLYGHDESTKKRHSARDKATRQNTEEGKKNDSDHENSDRDTASKHHKKKHHRHKEHEESPTNAVHHDGASSIAAASTTATQESSISTSDVADKSNKPDSHKPHVVKTNKLPKYTWFTEISDWELDSWDSVAHQPKCLLCKRAFKTNERLDHHVKYDNDHKENQLKVGKALEEQQFKEAQRLKLLNHSHDTLYNGMKTFYKTKTHVHLKLILHLAGRIVEVVPVLCLAEKGKELGQILFTYGKELNRLYFAYDKLLDVVAIIDKALKGRTPRAGAGGDDERSVHMSIMPGQDNDLHSDRLHKRATQHILSHLKLTLAPSDNAKEGDDGDSVTKPMLCYHNLITDEIQYNSPEVPISELPKWMVTPIASGGTLEPPPQPVVEAESVPDSSQKVEPIGKTVQDLTAFLEREKDYIDHVHETVGHAHAAAITTGKVAATDTAAAAAAEK